MHRRALAPNGDPNDIPWALWSWWSVCTLPCSMWALWITKSWSEHSLLRGAALLLPQASGKISTHTGMHWSCSTVNCKALLAPKKGCLPVLPSVSFWCRFGLGKGKLVSRQLNQNGLHAKRHIDHWRVIARTSRACRCKFEPEGEYSKAESIFKFLKFWRDPKIPNPQQHLEAFYWPHVIMPFFLCRIRKCLFSRDWPSSGSKYGKKHKNVLFKTFVFRQWNSNM